MRKLPYIAGSLALSAALMAGYLPIASAQQQQNTNQVTICHHPPGNPGNGQTMTVGLGASFAHLLHGDSLGACDNNGSSSSMSSASSVSSPRSSMSSSSLSSSSLSSLSSSSLSSSVSSTGSSLSSSSFSSPSSSSLSSMTGSSLSSSLNNSSVSSGMSSSMSSGSSLSSSSSSSSDDDDDDNGIFGRLRLNICHNPDGNNPQSMRLPIAAAISHFFHGDDFGRCDTEDEDDEEEPEDEDE